MSDYTAPKSGEHVIGYAYPWSPAAVALGLGDCGCWRVRTVDGTVGLSSYGACLEYVRQLGTAPGRWSDDHPLNAKLRPQGVPF